MSFKLDLHIHTELRKNIFIDAGQLRDALKRSRLDGVAVTNFYSITHAQYLQNELKSHIIIVGQEIWAKQGHIIGLGLKEKVADFQDARQTIADIHKQSGIAVAVHPYLRLGVGRSACYLGFDAIESYNALLGDFIFYNYLAGRLAKAKNIPALASSDISDHRFIGRSYTEVIADSPGLILEAIRRGSTRLYKCPVPFPFKFCIKGFIGCRDFEPCSLHAFPCLICGKSIAVRLFKQKFTCLYCGKVESSRIVCCNGHYLCKGCIIGQESNLLIRSKSSQR